MRSAPARTMRSTRYSETARGRSMSPSKRLPTGSSSLENASGWIRLPMPAAGMMPRMIRSFDERDQIGGAVGRRVLGEHALPGRAADGGEGARVTREMRQGFVGIAGDEDLRAGREERLQSVPRIGQ